MDTVCTLSMIVVLADGSDVLELGGDAGAMGARPDASAIAQHATVSSGRSKRGLAGYSKSAFL